MKILVTGALGFIGCHLVDYLVNDGYTVYSLDDLSGGFKKNLNPKSTFLKIDLRKKRQVENVIKKIKPEIIYHLAADASEGRSQFTPVNSTERNYLSTLNLLSSSINNNLKRFVFTSSMAVYGAQKPPFTESMETNPEDIYGISKASSEKALEVLSGVHNFEYVIIRPHNVYGPRQNMSDPYRNVVAIFINRLLKNKEIYIYGDGNQKRAFSFIEDIIPSIAKCGFKKNVNKEIINIGADKPYTINEMARILMEVSKKKVKIKYLSLRPCEVKFAYSNHKKAKKLLGFTDKTSLKLGLEKTWEWALSEGVKKPKYHEIEIEGKKLPKTWKERLI